MQRKASRILMVGAVVLALAAVFGVPVVKADSLHGQCTPACIDNGTVSPTNFATPTYGFTSSPGGDTGNLLVVALIPDNDTVGSFSVTGGTTSPATSDLVSTTAWTSGSLASYLATNDPSLGISGAKPDNPLGAFLPTTNTFNATATGYLVYVADLGTTTLPGNSSATTPLFDVVTGMPTTAFDFPLGSSIVGFLNTGTATSPDWVATASSGQISIQGTSTKPVPEPASLALLAIGLCALAGFARRMKLSIS